jgi:hypothetical protein
MTQEPRELEDRRCLRFAFDGLAEVAVDGLRDGLRARVTEFSFRGVT